MLARILGVILLIGGVAWAVKLIWLAFKAALSLVAGVFGVAFLLLQVALVLAILYVGWRWLDNGEFSLRR